MIEILLFVELCCSVAKEKERERERARKRRGSSRMSRRGERGIGRDSAPIPRARLAGLAWPGIGRFPR